LLGQIAGSLLQIKRLETDAERRAFDSSVTHHKMWLDNDLKLLNRPLWNRKDLFEDGDQVDKFEDTLDGPCYAENVPVEAEEEEFDFWLPETSAKRKAVEDCVEDRHRDKRREYDGGEDVASLCFFAQYRKCQGGREPTAAEVLITSHCYHLFLTPGTGFGVHLAFATGGKFRGLADAESI
jgi:hypothetical protein